MCPRRLEVPQKVSEFILLGALNIYIGAVVVMQLLGLLLTQILIMRIVGVGPDTDAFIAAQALPSVLGSITATVIQSVWMPRLSTSHLDTESWRQKQAIALGQAGILSGIPLMLSGISVSWWAPLLFPGFTTEQQYLTNFYCLLFLVVTAFNTQSIVLTVALRARNCFLLAESIALLGTVFSLVVMYFALPVWGLDVAAWALLGRALIVYIAQLWLANWPLLSITKGWDCHESWSLLKPLICGTSIYKTSPLFDRYLASNAPSGSMTILNLAQTIIAAAVNIMDRSISMPLLPRISQYVSQNDYISLQITYRRAIYLLTMVIFFIFIILYIVKSYFLLNISEIFNINKEFSLLLWNMLELLSIYLYAISANSIVTSTFYSMKNTAFPMKIGLYGFFIGVVLKITGFYIFGIIGLAFGITANAVFNFIIMYVNLDKFVQNFIRNNHE